MAHSCVDWTVTPPTRRAPFLVLSYGNRHLYAAIPSSFAILEEISRKKLNIGSADIEFHSSCANLCGNALVKIDEDAWEHVAPFIGCVLIILKEQPIRFIDDKQSEMDAAEQLFTVSGPKTVPSSSDTEIERENSDAQAQGAHYSHNLDGQIMQACMLHSSDGGPDDDDRAYRTFEKHTKSDPPVPNGNVPTLQRSPDRWIAPSFNRNCYADMASHSPEQGKRKFTGLLNKLSGMNINFICDRMVEWIYECHFDVRGQVLELAVELIFERAVDEPERMAVYASLIEHMIKSNKMLYKQSFRLGLAGEKGGYILIRDCLIKRLQAALQKKSLSWGEDALGSRTAHVAIIMGNIDEYYVAEREKRRGIGLASMVVELAKLNLFSRSVRSAYQDGLFPELLQALKQHPKEGDIVSLCIIVPHLDWRYWQRKSADYRRDCAAIAETLSRSHEVSRRLACRLQSLVDMCVEKSPPYMTYYHVQHHQLRYSVPDMSRCHVAQFVSSSRSQTVENSFATLIDYDYHWWFIRLLTLQALQDNRSIENFLAEALEKSLCTLDALEAGLTAAANSLDIAGAVDTQAYDGVIRIMKRVGFDKEEKRLLRIAREVKDMQRLVQLTLW